DELAKKLGQEDLASLKRAIKEEQERHYRAQARMRLKRDLLDALAKSYAFELPPRLLDTEFEHIWKHFEEHRKARDERKTKAEAHGHAHDHDHDHDHDHGHENDELTDYEGKSDDEIKAEFCGIAERRVRLGLLLAEI